ncbi:MAG: terpene cyclase/mutase family protein [Syntrophomonadaceae bacterium]|nr:terpene cyclase/mutase family protein [Syntrophomonadaceae bacterium]
MLRIRSKRWVFCSSWVLLIIFFSLLVHTPVATAATVDEIHSSLDKLRGYYNQVGECNDWETLGLRWAGVECSSKYTPENAVSASDYARKIMGAIAGRQAEAGINNDISTLIGMQKTAGDTKGSFINGDNTSLNQTIWAVIALDFAKTNGFTADYQRDDAVSYICSNQDAGGGFDESGWGVDVDSTTHALIALAADYNQAGKEECTTTVNKALTYLQQQQMDTGGFGGWGSESPDSIAAVIEALMALSKNPFAEDWIKNGNNMVDALLAYQSGQGWFVYSWEASGWNDPTVPNQMSTYHSLLALGDLVQGQSKYRNLLPETNGLCFTLQPADSFNLGNDANMSFLLDNKGNNSIAVLIAAGLFDTSNEHQLTLTSLSKTLLPGESVDFGSAFTIPAGGSYEVRVFVWDNWNDKNSLLVPSFIPVQ